MRQICRVWGTTDIKWSNANWLWSECQLVEEIIVSGGVDASTLIQPWMLEDKWNPYKTPKESEKRNRLIKLICKVKKVEYIEEKEMKDFKITVGDVKLVVKAVSGIDLDLKLEE